MLMGDDDEHRLARPNDAPVAFVLETSGPGQRDLQDREWRAPPLLTVPVVRGIRRNFIAGACRHYVQTITAVGEGYGAAIRAAKLH
jgi:hypothetical protein